MKEELTNEKLREAEDKEIDIQELLFKYLIHWPRSEEHTSELQSHA